MLLSGFLSNYRDIEIPLEDIIEAYTIWVQEHRYMIMERNKPVWDAPHSSTMFDRETIAVKCAKRGNDVYVRRVESRFSAYEKLLALDNRLCFDRGKMRSQVIFATLTYDPSLRSQHQAWVTLSYFYNLFMARLRRVFGSISTLRTFESFENGYPHIHVIMLFNDFSFQVHGITNKKGHRILAIDDDLNECIAALWHSWVDIKAVGDLRESIAYLRKYITKCVEFNQADGKGVKTLAQCWAYRRRAFCVAGMFRERLHDLIVSMQISNSNQIQMTLENEKLEENKWTCLGFVSIDVLEIEPFTWRLSLSGELRERVYEALNEQENEKHC
jgi:hypothetical protein